MDTSDRTADEIRERLVRVGDEIRSLPGDAYAARHVLRSEADDLRTQLRAVSGDNDLTAQRWADRAARKAGHDQAAQAQLAELTVVTLGRSNDGGC